MLAALNYLDILTADIQNAYLNAPAAEKVWCVCGLEFEKSNGARGKELVIRCFVDADHVGDKLTRRSRTGMITYMNMAPIVWYPKRQNCVETSTFGSEFVAMKVATGQLIRDYDTSCG
jgi:hypothetical protein